MKSSYQFAAVAREKLGMAHGRHAVFMAVLLAVVLGMARTSSAQVAASGEQGGFSIRAGATASGYQVQYGQQQLLGIAGVVDLDTRRSIGLEAEGRWLMFNNPNQMKITTYMGGPRYHRSLGKFQIYGKGLVGIGQFTFPYNYAQGTYLVIAPGGGIDYRWKRKISIRVADFEYQIWPQFTYGSMTSAGVSAGILYHIF
jgi:hypothetical protein